MKRQAVRWVLAGMIGVGAWAQEEALPRVMLLMDEKNVGGYSVDQAAMAMTEHLLALGYDVIDADLVKTRLKRDQALQAMTGGDQAAAALGLEFGADVIVVGRAVAKGSALPIENTSLRAYQATVTAKAIQTDTARTLATAEGAASRTHLDDTAGGSEAIRAAALTMTGELFKRMTRRDEAAGPVVNAIHLVVGDIRQVWQLAAIRRTLTGGIPGVHKATQRSFIAGVGTFDVRTEQSAQTFGESLVLAGGEDIKFQVLAITGAKIDARLVVPRPAAP